MRHKASSVGGSAELPFCFFLYKSRNRVGEKEWFYWMESKILLTKEDFYRTIKSSENWTIKFLGANVGKSSQTLEGDQLWN